MPRTSIIMPTYNSENYMVGSINSIINQADPNWELFIIDDCSIDGSHDIAKKFAANDERINAIRLSSNSGAAVARNTGIEKAKGRFIAFLDSDDMWLPNKLEQQINFMLQNEHVFTFTSYEKIDESCTLLGDVMIPNQVSYIDLLKSCSIGCLTAMYDTSKLGKIYMPLIRKRQDLGLWLRILKQTPFAYGLNEKLAQYRIRKDSISSNKLNAAKHTWKLYRDHEKLSLPVATYYFLHYAVNGTIKTKFPALYNLLRK